MVVGFSGQERSKLHICCNAVALVETKLIPSLSLYFCGLLLPFVLHLQSVALSSFVCH